MLVGGHSAPKVPDAETAAQFAGLRPQLEAANGGKAFSTWEVVEYTSQVVAGIIYKVKAKVSDSEYVHFRVFQPLGGKPLELQSSQFGQTRDAAL